MDKDYIGIIVEESLDDNRLLNDLNIRKLHISSHANPADRWHMYEVNVSKDEIQKLSMHIVNDWYMHFWRGIDIIAVFNGRTFEFNYENRETWNEVLEYGRSMGLKFNN